MPFGKQLPIFVLSLVISTIAFTQTQSQTLPNTPNYSSKTTLLANEYDLKATFIFKFIDYIEWNSPVPSDSIRIAVIGTSNIISPLKLAAKQKDIQNKPVALYFYSNLTEATLSAMEKRKVQLIFVAKSVQTTTVQKLVRSAVSRNALIVGEREGFTREGGHLNFINQDDKIRFETSPASFSNCTFKLSHQLLRLAQIVS